MKNKFKLGFIFILTIITGLVLIACDNGDDTLDKALTNLTVETILGDNESKDAITKDLVLPTKDGEVVISWDSNKPAVITAAGKVTRQDADETVRLTATLSYDGAEEDKHFDLVVLKSDGEVDPDEEFTVTFNSDGGTSVASQTVEDGAKATKPANPTKAGFKFLGWFLGEVEFNFDTAITADITLVAKWEDQAALDLAAFIATLTPTESTETFDYEGVYSDTRIDAISGTGSMVALFEKILTPTDGIEVVSFGEVTEVTIPNVKEKLVELMTADGRTTVGQLADVSLEIPVVYKKGSAEETVTFTFNFDPSGLGLSDAGTLKEYVDSLEKEATENFEGYEVTLYKDTLISEISGTGAMADLVANLPTDVKVKSIAGYTLVADNNANMAGIKAALVALMEAQSEDNTLGGLDGKSISYDVVFTKGAETATATFKVTYATSGLSKSNEKLVKTVAELEAALLDEAVTEITIDGTLGSDSAYTIYNVNRAVTIQGAAEAKVYGSFIVKADDVTIKDLAIQNKGDLELENGKTESSTNRGGIYVFANNVTLTNNTITNGLGTKAGLSNAIQIMSPTANNPLSNYVITGNKLIGHDNEVTNWSSSGIVIAQGYKPGSIGEEVLAITASLEDYANLLSGNTFENNKIDLTHQDWSKTGDDIVLYPVDETKAVVTDKAELEAALGNNQVTDITIKGTLGTESDYTIYQVDRAVTIKGVDGAKVYGSFIVKVDDVTIKDLAIQNKGDLELENGKTESSTNRGGIYVFANNVTLTNNTITNGLGTKAGLSNAIQIMSPTANNPLSNYVITGNKLIGHDNEVTNWSSSGIVIAQGYKPGSIGEEVLAITASLEDYANLLSGNTFENNKIDLTHQDWSKTGDDIVLYPVSVDEE